MQPIRLFTFFAIFVFAIACKKEDDTPTIIASLSEPEITSKTGREINTTLTINSPTPIQSLVIIKTINTFVDNLWETDGKYTATLASGGNNTYTYDFNYEVLDRDADKLIGFTFEFTDANGNVFQRDLTLNAILSAEQTLYTRRWKMVGKLWTSVQPAVNDLKDCESDDVWEFNSDGTWNIDFGSKACEYDGFNSFPLWNINEEETLLNATLRNVFTGADDVQVYDILTLNRERLILNQTVDLSVFGFGLETFTITFEASN